MYFSYSYVPFSASHIIDPCAKNMTQVKWKFLFMKSSKAHFIFLPAFYLIMWLMISPKNFEKIAILKIQQLFSSEVSKFTSVWNKPNLALKYWFIEARLVFCTCYGHKKWSKCHLDTMQTTFSEAEVSFNTSEENQQSYFQNGFFPKFFADVMSYIIR